MTISIPPNVRANLEKYGGAEWLANLPTVIPELAERWKITPGEPFNAEASCSWVAPCTCADAGEAIFKIGWPHMEAEDEIAGLRFWNGDPTAFLLQADETHNAMLLERCVPGTTLRELPLAEQDVIIARLLQRLWREPGELYDFRSLAKMVTYWTEEAENRADQWIDPAIAQAGIQAWQHLIETTKTHVLLATDLHAGNVLQAQREPWLAIDPKPFTGDPAYDATQHLFNEWEPLAADPLGRIERFANLLEVDAAWVRLWMFARAATNEAGDADKCLALAKKLAV